MSNKHKEISKDLDTQTTKGAKTLSEIENLKAEVKSKDEAAKSLDAKIRQLESELVKSLKSLSDEQTKLGGKVDELQALQKEIKELKSNYSDHEKLAKATEEKLKSLASEKGKLESKLQVVTSSSGELSEELKAVKSKLACHK